MQDTKHPYRSPWQLTKLFAMLIVVLACTVLTFGIALEAAATLYPPILQLSRNCWEGSCWWNSLDPLGNLNAEHPIRMLFGYAIGASVLIWIASNAFHAGNRQELLCAASDRRRGRLASNRREALKDSLTAVDMAIERLLHQRDVIAHRLDRKQAPQS